VHPAPEDSRARTRRWLATSRVAVTVALVVALVGLALPYGASTPGDDAGLTPLEWCLSALALLAALGLVLDATRPLHPRLSASGVAFAVAGAVWVAVAAYHVLISGDVGLTYALSEALRCLGWAALALYEWRAVAISSRRRREGMAP
jgi:O-antigen/teichoic acid export membrane protein